MKKYFFCAVALLLSLQGISQDEGDKSQYNLFNPVPEDQLRPLAGDRPDFTESAYTVDAGHLQIEADIARLNISRVGNNMRLTDFSALNTAFRLGLLNWLEIQFMAEAAHFYRTFDDRPDEYYYVPRYLQEAGIRVKANLVGNDEGSFAMAVMPYVVYQNFGPLADSIIDKGNFLPRVDPNPMYGIALPVSYEINHKWEVAAMVEYQFDDFFTTFAYMAVIGHNVTERFSVLAEVYNSHTTTTFSGFESPSMDPILNLAFTQRGEKRFQFDAGVAIGLQEGSGISPYTGFLVRF